MTAPVLPDGRYECHCCGVPLVPGGPVFCSGCYHANELPWTYCPDYTPGQPHADCPQCGGFGAVPEEQPAPPAPDEVREAAEGLRARLSNVRWVREYEEHAPGLLADAEDLLAALGARRRG